MFLSKFRIVVLVITLCVTNYSFSQMKLDSMQHIDEITVVAKNYKEIIPAQKLSGIQLEQLNSHSVADALRYFAGVQLKDYGGVGGLRTVNIRSMGTNHVGVFFDGIQLGNAQNGQVDLGRFSLDDLEEISLYNGQKSEIFQSAKDYGSAAAIYLKSRKPQFIDAKTTNLIVRYRTASINLINPSFRMEHKLNKKLSFNLSSEYLKTNGKYKFQLKKNLPDGSIAYDTTLIRQNSDVRALRSEAGLFGQLDNGFWDTKVYYYDSERGVPGAVLQNDKAFDDILQGQLKRQWDRNFFVQSSLQKDITDKYKIQFRAKYAHDYMHYINADTILTINNTYYQQELYFSLANMYSITHFWDLSLSTDFEWNKLDANLVDFSYPRRYTTLVSLATALRLQKFKMQASLLATFVQNKALLNASIGNKDEYTPAIFMGYKPFGKYDFNIRAFYKNIFRMPTFNDLYYADIRYSVLKPEYTTQYNVGITYSKKMRHKLLRKIEFQTDIYYIEQRDKIIASPTLSLFRWRMTNTDKVETRGVDLITNLSGQINKLALDARLIYTYQKSKDFSPDSPIYGDQIPYIPWHSGSFILNGIYKTWNLNYSFIYTGERYDGNKNNNQYNYLQPWYTHDMSVQKYFFYKTYKFKATVEVNNVFNQFYEVVRNYPMQGQNFNFILSIEL